MENCGIDSAVRNKACPITHIRVADQKSPSHLDFNATDIGGDPFGWIMDNNLFQNILEQRVKDFKNIRVIYGAALDNIVTDEATAQLMLSDGIVVEAELVVGADGRHSQCRELANIPTYGWAYGQSAIACVIGHSEPHNNIAVEHFEPGGPFAVLPMTGQRSSIVWTEKTDVADALMQMDEVAFVSLLQEKTRDYLGTIQLGGKRFCYPLSLQHAERYTAPRLALIGDAAHAIHPIAGQGLNLGMGDIAVLSEELLRASRLGLDLGGADILRRYLQRRNMDNGNMVLATDLLDRLFSTTAPPVQMARRLGLSVVQNMPPLKKFFMRTAMGLHAKAS
jgi:2-octaprenyl-6-methoxyphenol hydroxylase